LLALAAHFLRCPFRIYVRLRLALSDVSPRRLLPSLALASCRSHSLRTPYAVQIYVALRLALSDVSPRRLVRIRRVSALQSGPSSLHMDLLRPPRVRVRSLACCSTSASNGRPSHAYSPRCPLARRTLLRALSLCASATLVPNRSAGLGEANTPFARRARLCLRDYFSPPPGCWTPVHCVVS